MLTNEIQTFFSHSHYTIVFEMYCSMFACVHIFVFVYVFICFDDGLLCLSQNKLSVSVLFCSVQNLVKFCPFTLKIWSKNQILTSIKGRNSVANVRKTTIYNTNVDLVHDDVYTKFGLILSIRSQDIE